MRLIQISKKPQKNLDTKKIYSVENAFRPVGIGNYPSTNSIEWEQWVFENFNPKGNESREYLPIFFTNIINLYIHKQYDLESLITHLLTINRKKKYWTVIQHDYGIDHILSYIWAGIHDLDILYFSSSKNKSIPVPLMSRYDIGSGKEWKDRTCFISFVGAIQNRHYIREKIRDVLSNKKDVIISESQTYEKFVDILKNTKFALCPRGAGATSFRIQESLQAGCIPVYVSDEFILPFHQPYVEYVPFTEYGILVKPAEIDQLYSILSEIPPEKIENMLKIGKQVSAEYYTYEGTLNMIKKILIQN